VLVVCLFVCLSAPLLVFVCVAVHMLIGAEPSSYRRAFKLAKPNGTTRNFSLWLRSLAINQICV